MAGDREEAGIQVLLRDISDDMVQAWSDPQAFGGDGYKDFVQVCYIVTYKYELPGYHCTSTLLIYR